jgi:hypothetical protein
VQPIWLIEAAVYGDEVSPLQAEIARQGMRTAVLTYLALKKGATVMIDGQPIGPSDCVIGYGTYPFARQIQLHRPWVPGSWCDVEKLDCARYYAYFGKFLLNQTYAIMPGVEAIRQRRWIFSMYGADGEVFARPTGCHKLFVGRRIPGDSFESALAPTRYDPETLVVVASPRSIDREWRLVVIGDRVIAGSQYALGGKRNIEAGCPAEVQSFAAAMLAEVRWRPDPVFMLDVCESGARLWLVELNGFSTSWLYRCDPAVVVAEVSEEATRRWTRSGC